MDIYKGFPAYERGPVRDMILRELDVEGLLDEYATASLKRITSDTNKQEKVWEEYWYDLRSEIEYRIPG